MLNNKNIAIKDILKGASQVAPVVKNLPTNVQDARDMGSIPGSERSPGVGSGNPLQYSYLENLMNNTTKKNDTFGGIVLKPLILNILMTPSLVFEKINILF